MRFVLFMAVLGWLGACSAPPQGTALEGPSGGPDSDWCGAAEGRLEELDCRDPRGEPVWVNRNGEGFADTCRKVQDEGGVFLNPRCVAETGSCEEAMTCPRQ